jgi:hypothetical protein
MSNPVFRMFFISFFFLFMANANPERSDSVLDDEDEVDPITVEWNPSGSQIKLASTRQDLSGILSQREAAKDSTTHLHKTK